MYFISMHVKVAKEQREYLSFKTRNDKYKVMKPFGVEFLK